MVLWRDRFAGHLRPGDYRGPLHGAGGCTWPTIPAARYLLWSDDAIGWFWPLRYTGILVQVVDQQINHDLIAYNHLTGPPGMTCTKFQKDIWEDQLGYTWTIHLDAGSPCGGTLVWELPFAEKKCNGFILLGDKGCVSQPGWRTGSAFIAAPVEYNKILPTSPPTPPP